LSLSKEEGDDLIYTLGDDSTITLSNGSYVRLALRATNGAGLSTIGYSNGIILDTSKPEIPTVELGIVDGDEGFVTLNYLLDEEVNLTLSAEDYESDISQYSYEAVIYSDGDWVSLGEESWVDKSEGETVQTSVPTEEEDLADYDVLYYRATAYNNTGDPSTMAGYSNGAVNYQDVSLLVDGVAQGSNGTVLVTWDVQDDIPLEEIYISLEPLYESTYSVEETTIDGSLTSYSFTDVPDGYYRAQLRCKAVYGTVSDEETWTNTVLVDSEAPVLSDFSYDDYVYDYLDYGFTMEDSLSGVTGYRYRVGTVGQPDLLTGGWVTVDSTASEISESLSIEDDLAGGVDGLYSADGVILSVQVVDRSGNWSAVTYSDPIIVDNTAPAAPVVQMELTLEIDQDLTGYEEESYTRDNSYIVSSGAIENLLIDSLDEESGLAGYYWAVQSVDDESDPVWSSLVSLDEETVEEGVFEADLDSSESLIMADGESYLVYIKTENQVGLVSEAGVSGALLADLTAPLFTIDGENSGVGYEEGIIIFNGTDSVVLADVEETSDILILDYTWTNDESETLSEGTSYYFGRENFTGLSVPFEPEDEADSGNYDLTVTLSDSGGYETTLTQTVRLNASPVLSVSELSTNPMRPLEWDVWSDLYDVDGIDEVSLTISDYEDNTVDQVDLASGTIYTIELGHPDSTPYAQESTYTLTVVSTDSYGQSSESEVTLTIYNTTAGLLYTDEYWSGEHWLTALVTVPEDLTLTVAEESSILMSLTDEDDPPGLFIEGTLTHEGSAVYEWDGDQSGYWQGIYIQGEATLDDITVREAERGIVLDSDLVTDLEGISFEENLIGLHLLGLSPEIRDCSFEDNVHYGIKEDGECEPQFRDNTFSGNGYDYYDSELTVLDGDDLTTMNSNTGPGAGNGR
ncbi:MAG: hypothetical protein PQJ60_04145, partial [Spirochaetales bacterium]|nr:hypothetical protein [Spirochaetales bacterium]